MNPPKAWADSPKCRWYQYSVRQLLVAVAVLSVLLSWFVPWYRTRVEITNTERQITATIDALAKKRPPTMTRGQWASAVAWTNNLVGNSVLRFDAELEDLRRFQGELEERTKGDVDMATILWIWDQHAHLTRAGREYQKFRQQMLDEIERVGPDDDPWGMNVP